MKSSVCPKCGSTEIYTEEGGSTRDYLPGGSIFNPLLLINYACGDCGYLETYVDRDRLELLKKKWARLTPRTTA